MPEKIPLLILGSGAAGMGAAWKAKTAGIEFKIIDVSDHAGGMLQTEYLHGHILDQGPSSCVQSPLLLEFLSYLGISDQVVTASAKGKKRYIYQRNGIKPVHGLKDIFLGNWMSTKGKLRLLIEPFCKKGTHNDETVYDFLKRRIGEEAVNKLVDPVLGGIYAGDIKKLSALTVLKSMKLGEQRYGSLLRTVLNNKSSPRIITNIQGGFSSIGHAFEAKFKNECLLGHKVEGITSLSSGFEVIVNGKRLLCERIISTLPTYVLADVISSVSLKTHLNELSYAPLCTSFYSLDGDCEIADSAFGILIPSGLKKIIKGILFVSNIFPGRSNEGESNMTVFHSKSPNDEAINIELEQILGKQQTSLLAQRTWENAIPQFELGFQDWKRHLKETIPNGMFLAGNYLGKVGVSDVLESGYDLRL